MCGLEHAGIGRYVENLVRQLGKSRSKEFEFVLFVRKKDNNHLTIQPFNHFSIVEADYSHYSFQEQVYMPIALWRAKCDLVHFPHFNVPVFYCGKYVVTIHDLIKHTSRGMATTTRNSFLYWLKYLGYRFGFWNAVKRAKIVVVPSRAIKDELIHRYNLATDKIRVIYEGADEKFKTKNQKPKTKNTNLKTLKKYGISKPFIVYTGSLYPHKNIERLIKAIKIFNLSLITYLPVLPPPDSLRDSKRAGAAKRWQAGHLSLIIVCSRNVFWERIKKRVREIGAEKFVNLVGFVPDEDLVKIYQEALALIQPSLMEGFDLTAVEAMAAGLPVVVSDIAVHREICGQAALHFDAKNIRDIADKINLVLKDKSLRTRLKKLGLKQAKKYSWQKMAKQTLRVYGETWKYLKKKKPLVGTKPHKGLFRSD